METLDDLLPESDGEGGASGIGAPFSFAALSRGLMQTDNILPTSKHETGEPKMPACADLSCNFSVGSLCSESNPADDLCSGDGVDDQDGRGLKTQGLWGISSLDGSSKDPFARGSALLHAASSAQTTVDGGASPAPNSDEGTEGGIGLSPGSTPRSSASLEPPHGLLGSELFAKSALVRASTNREVDPDQSIVTDEQGSDQEQDICMTESVGTVSTQMQSRNTVSTMSENHRSFSNSTANMHDSDDILENPIKASGAYKLDASDAGPSHTQQNPVIRDTVPATPKVASTAVNEAAPPQPRAFLKKGSRMARWDVPKDDRATGVSKPSVSTGMKKSLRLQPRSASEPAVARKLPGSHPDAAPCEDQQEGYSAAHKVDTPNSRQQSQASAVSHCTSQPTRAQPRVDTQWGSGIQVANSNVESTKTGTKDQTVLSSRKTPTHKEMHDVLCDDWTDTLPWDCRGNNLDLELDLDEFVDRNSMKKHFSSEPPTSNVVASYFQSTSSPVASNLQSAHQSMQHEHCNNKRYSKARHPQWEGEDAYSVLYNQKSVCGETAQETAQKPSHPTLHPNFTALEQEAQQKASALDQQVSKCEQEAERLKKLQARAEQAERDFQREREKLWCEVEAERHALHAEFDVERAALKRERRRLSQGAERQRLQLTEDREMVEEKRKLREHSEQLEEEMKEKDKRWQRTVDRLQRQITDLNRKNVELQEEVKRANSQAQQLQNMPPSHELRRSASTASARGRRQHTSNTAPKAGNVNDCMMLQPGQSSTSSSSLHPRPVDVTAGPRRNTGFDGVFAGRRGSSASASQIPDFNPATRIAGKRDDRNQDPGRVKSGNGSEQQLQPQDSSSAAADDLPSPSTAWSSTDIKEVRSLEGRTERIFKDGRREIEFANGLRKVIWTDGRTTVMFQNGDQKEMHPDGVVVYHYCATGAVQTTLPDGAELYQFADGQFEHHRADSSKEIRFPNGTSKRIFADGSEEVCFPDGTIKRTPGVNETVPK